MLAVHALGVDRLSFLGADVTSRAFNRPEPWPSERQQEIALSREDLIPFARAIVRAHEQCGELFASGFVQDGVDGLRRIHDRSAATAGAGAWPVVNCNAPWVSAVLEPDGVVRPCFFHAPYAASSGASLLEAVNSTTAVAFRRSLDVQRDDTCRRCVCSLSLPLTTAV